MNNSFDNNRDNRDQPSHNASIPKCKCEECATTLNQIKDFNTHLSKMYSQMNYHNQSIQSQNDTLSKVFKELIPLLKGIDAKMKQTNAMLLKLSQ